MLQSNMNYCNYRGYAEIQKRSHSLVIRSKLIHTSSSGARENKIPQEREEGHSPQGVFESRKTLRDTSIALYCLIRPTTTELSR